MGTFNYSNNNLFNLGLDVFSKNYDDIAPEDLDYYVEDYYNLVLDIISNYYFRFIEIKIEPGYYEGFYLSIESCSDQLYCFENYIEKQEAIKELQQFKKLVIELLESGLVWYHAHWCSSYMTYTENKKQINKLLNTAIKDEREKLKAIPTAKNYTFSFIKNY